MFERFLVSGDSVVVPARVAYLIEREFRIDERRADLRGRDAEFDSVLLAFHAAAMVWRQKVGASEAPGAGSACGTVVAEPAEPGRRSTGQPTGVSTEAAALRCGLGPRAVRRAAAEGRLPGRKDGDVWVFDPADVEAFAEGRRIGA